MAGYIGSKGGVVQVDGYTESEADAEFVTKTGDTITGNLSFGDNDKAIFGAGSDLQIYHSGSTSFIRDMGDGDLQIFANDDVFIRGQSTNNYMARFSETGAVTLYHNNASKLATTSTGINVTGNATFADNGKAIFGAGSDLQIYHSGTNSFIDDAGTGNLQIRASSQIKLQKYTGENMFVGIADGAASMYYNNSQKIATTSTGIDVTGQVDVNSAARIDSSGIVKAANGTAAAPTHSFLNDPDNGMFRATTNTIGFSTAGAERMRIDSSGNLLVGTTDTTLWTATSGGGILARPNTSTVIARESTSATQPLLILNETGVDGTLQEFRKDGSIVGSIGVFNSDTVIGTGVAGLRMNDGSPAITPHRMDTNAVADNSIDLGNGSARFKDLYLSGTVNASTVDLGNWTVTESGGSIYFATGGVNKMKLDASGNLDVVGNVNSNATIT